MLVEADSDDPGYASRGGHKLAGALDALPVPVEGRRVLDAGASTGGFTDVLLRRGAREVVAVDVGYGQLAWRLRTDPTGERARPHQRPRADPGRRSAARSSSPSPTCRSSRCALVLPALAALHRASDLLPMVKPQFEVGRERVGAKGVVRDPAAAGRGDPHGRATGRTSWGSAPGG